MSSPAQIFSANLIAQLASYGVEFWLAPGARSQSLAIAAAQIAEGDIGQLHVRVDERSLGFHALGAATTGRAQVVITTSGTAVANLHPAVLEAHHSGLPLILLTADRPEELRGKGANQTTNQVGIFGDAVIECIDVAAPREDSLDLAQQARVLADRAIHTAINNRQPVQLNLQFVEPLSDVEPDAYEIFKTLPRQEVRREWDTFTKFPLSKNAVVIAGATAHEYVDEIMELGLPVFAEPTSGVRHLSSSILGYRFVLATNSPLVGQIDQIIVYGKPTLSRQVISLLRSPKVEVIVRHSQMGDFLIPENAKTLYQAIESDTADRAWLESWQQVSIALTPEPTNAFDRRAIIEKVWELGQDGQLVLGASQLIREADHYAPRRMFHVWANRGLAGIDGTIATASGLAHATSMPVRLLLGDLAFLHDVGSLVTDPTEEEIDLQVVVVNDHGGKIFENLEVAKTASKSIYDRVFRTGQEFNIAQLAKAFGWQYQLVSSAAELAEALELRGRVIIEARID